MLVGQAHERRKGENAYIGTFVDSTAKPSGRISTHSLMFSSTMSFLWVHHAYTPMKYGVTYGWMRDT